LARLFADDIKETKEDTARNLLKKPYREVTAAELAELSEEILKGLLMFRKNAPFSFVNTINLVLGHPNTPFLTKNNLRIALELFDFDLNELNADKFIVEQDVDWAEALPSEEPLDGVRCHEAFFQSSTLTSKQTPQKQPEKAFKEISKN